MLYNYLTIAIRNLSKNRLFTALNIGGLSIGLAVAIIIGLYVRDEFSYDRFNAKADRLYRVNFDVRYGGREQNVAVASAPLGATMVHDYPVVESMCRFRQWGAIAVRKGEESIEELSNSYTDSTFFELFSIPLIEGSPKTALNEPGTGVITESIAKKYFGTSTGVLGRTLRINENRDMRITGVMRDIPKQSHFHYDFLFPMVDIKPEADAENWLSNNFQTYLLLRPGASATDLEKRMAELADRYVGPFFEKATGGHMSEFYAAGNWLRFGLIPVTDIHLHSARLAEHEANSDIKYVWIFSLVALMVLFLACVNFMNLSTARSTGRAREVGVRKALGSNRGALISQFLTESLVLTLVSFTLATLLARLALPAFNTFADKDIHLSLSDMPLLGSLGALTVLTALIAGSYPAFFLSAFRPIEVLRGKFTGKKGGGAWVRSGLVVFQFFISIALITCVLVVQNQLAFIQQKKLGYEKDHLVMLRNTWWLQQKTLDFRNQLLKIPGIESVSCADFFPTPSPRNSTTFVEEGKKMSDASLPAQCWQVDFDYQKTFGLKMKEGRWFDLNLPTDSNKCVINESAVKALGWTNPVGKKVSNYADADLKTLVSYEVIGVVKDFNFESLRESITPLVMNIGRGSGTMALRFSKTADLPATIDAVKSQFKAYLPAQPFVYRFIDEEFDQEYRAERRIGSILGAFAGIAIFIACLGLFGLVAYTAERRTKEIGIRKVLGAGVSGITALLARDFLKLVLVAILLALPVAYYFMQQWLSDFAYRIALKWWIFALSGIAGIVIALATVSFQSIKTALGNPVKALQSE